MLLAFWRQFEALICDISQMLTMQHKEVFNHMLSLNMHVNCMLAQMCQLRKQHYLHVAISFSPFLLYRQNKENTITPAHTLQVLSCLCKIFTE